MVLYFRSDFQAHPGYCKIRNADFSLEITVSADGQQITSCSVSWFGERAVEAQALRLYVSRNRWDLVHTALTAMFHLVPSDLSRWCHLFLSIFNYSCSCCPFYPLNMELIIDNQFHPDILFNTLLRIVTLSKSLQKLF